MTDALPQPRWLQRIETLGNRLPHPTLLFVWFCALVLALSWLLNLTGFSATHPATHELITVTNLLSQSGLHKILQNTVTEGVFIGATIDSKFRAFDVRTGAELWVDRLDAPAHSVPSTYMGRDGKQYVVVAAGGRGFLQSPGADTLVAYTLP